MNYNTPKMERVVAATGTIFLTIAAISAFFMNGDEYSFIHFFVDSRKFIICTHLLCVLLSIIYLVKPNTFLFIVVMTIESVLTILTRYETLGIFFFYSNIIILITSHDLTHRIKRIICILSIIHIASLVLIYPHGWSYVFIAFGTSLFFLSFYICIYNILKSRFSCFLPKNVVNNKTISGIKLGQHLFLSKYNLSERQANFVLENLYNSLSYSDISNKYNVSISLVKKEFQAVFVIFDVGKLEELRTLLYQYQVKK